MKEINVGEAFKEGWKSFGQRPWFLFGLALSVMILFILGGTSNGLVTALAYIVYGGYLVVILKHFRGEKAHFDDLFSLDNRWISFAFLGLIKGILIFIGFVLFIVPGVYLALRWMFAELLVIDQGMKPLEALRASSDMTKGHMWKLFWFSIVAFVYSIVGLLLLGVGAVVASIVIVLATIHLYKGLKNKPTVMEVQ